MGYDSAKPWISACICGVAATFFLNSCRPRTFLSESKAASTASRMQSWASLSQSELMRREEQTSELKAAARSDLSRRFFEAKARQYDVYSYKFDLDFNWNQKFLQGAVEIRFTPKSGTLRTVTLDSAVRIKEVTTLDGTPLQFSQDDSTQELTIKLLLGGTSGIHERMRDPNSDLLTMRIEYETEWPNLVPSRDGIGLVLSKLLDSDPVRSQILYTNSEPEFAKYWAPLNVDPSDRALVQFIAHTDPELDFVANGKRVSSSIHQGRRETIYSLDQPIPMYVAAFATGPIEFVADYSHSVPLKVWYRKGAQLPAAANLELFAKAMGFLESRLGKYPWNEYGTVLIPEFGGGEENVSLTFQTDIGSSTATTPPELVAHEMAHQWFGDLITVRTWNDLWIKEGMATLLASEFAALQLSSGDQNGYPGFSLAYNGTDAVRDESLPPSGKYTSGPYMRAASVFNQVRLVVGENNFWKIVRGLLQKHNLSSISTEQVLAAFRPYLTLLQYASLQNAIRAKEASTISISNISGKDGFYSIQFNNPANFELLNLEVAQVNNETGEFSVLEIPPGNAAQVQHDATVTTILDPRGWRALYTKTQAEFQFLASGEGVADIMSTNHLSFRALAFQQSRLYSAKFAALLAANSNQFSAQDSLPLLTRTRDKRVHTIILNKTCNWAREDESSRFPSWSRAIAPFFADAVLDYMANSVFEVSDIFNAPTTSSFGKCPISWFTRFGGVEVNSALAAPLATPIDRLFSLANLDFSPQNVTAFWYQSIFKPAPNQILRALAQKRLEHTFNAGFTKPPSTDFSYWEAFILELLASTSNQSIYSAVTIAKEMENIPLLARAFGRAAALESPWWTIYVCTAWPAFKDAPASVWAQAVAPFRSMRIFDPQTESAILDNTAASCFF